MHSREPMHGCEETRETGTDSPDAQLGIPSLGRNLDPLLGVPSILHLYRIGALRSQSPRSLSKGAFSGRLKLTRCCSGCWQRSNYQRGSLLILSYLVLLGGFVFAPNVGCLERVTT